MNTSCSNALRNSLQGITIIDLSLLLPGPYCTKLLQGYGARVISVKPPQGDLLQTLPPYLPTPEHHPVGAYFDYLHRDKTLITLDLKTATDHAKLLELLSNADLLVEGFRPGVMARLNLNPEDLRARFPRLIICSITGYGQTGPARDLAGHDLNYLAQSGFLDHHIRTSGPSLPALPLGDFIGGSLAAIQEIALALYQREKTGCGSILDIAMSPKLESLLLGMAAFQTTLAGQEEEPFLRFFASPRYALYQSKDCDWFALACIEDKFWKNFCAATKRLDLLDDQTYPAATNPCIDDPALRQALTVLFKTQPSSVWQTLATATDTCLTPVTRYQVK